MSDYDITGVFCPTHGPLNDAREYLNALHGYYAYEGVRELHREWNKFFANAPQDATILIYAHSRGAVYLRNALMTYPPELRERIEIIGIAPGGYISPKLCKSIQHFESSADVVPLLDAGGRTRCKDTIVTLSPHPEASKWFDHRFTSPTYNGPIRGEYGKI